LHYLIIGRSALRQQNGLRHRLKRNRYANLEFAIVWVKIIFAKFSQEKTPDTSYMQCRRTPYLLARAHRTSLTFMARVNFVGITETQVSCNPEFM
jgi:hypothetical protein